MRFDPVERPQALLAPPDGHDVIQFEKDGPLNDKSDGDTLIIRLGLFTPSDHESACLSLILVFQIITFSLSESNADVASSSRRTHMGPEGPSNFIKKLKGSVLAIFFFVVT